MNGYAISFDMDIEALRQYYGEPYNPAYAEIRSVMLSCGFYWIQGSVYVTPGNLATMYKAIETLKRIEWFRLSVRDIRGFKVEEWSDFTDIFKS